jgi:anti-sigma B factor antagonist
MSLLLEGSTEGRWTVLRVEGELDLYTSPELRDRLLGLVEEGSGDVALNLTGVTFMDSSSLGTLVTCLKRLREKDRALALVGVNGAPLKVLTLTGLDKVFSLFPSASELPQT